MLVSASLSPAPARSLRKGVVVLADDPTMTAAARIQASFAAATENIADVRRLVTAILHSWRYAGAVDGAVLATDELFANAVEHGCLSEDDTITVTITVDCRTNHLRIAVTDPSPHLPLMREIDTWAERGRGLAIVQELSDGWGAEAAEDGKQVWFTMRLP